MACGNLNLLGGPHIWLQLSVRLMGKIQSSAEHVGKQWSPWSFMQELSDSGLQLQGKCTFGSRLSDDDVQRLTQYVLERADADWK